MGLLHWVPFIVIFARFLVAYKSLQCLLLTRKERHLHWPGLGLRHYYSPLSEVFLLVVWDKSYQAFSGKKNTPSKRDKNDIAGTQKKSTNLSFYPKFGFGHHCRIHIHPVNYCLLITEVEPY